MKPDACYLVERSSRMVIAAPIPATPKTTTMNQQHISSNLPQQPHHAFVAPQCHGTSSTCG
ncbi:MAG: hypothetical protein MI923_04165 [Phycisphaerales bacterium]|nr:hypothetical protein [Phycisphaerales bacterium]